jgi:nicotinate-nucleotide pyrophosphorylase (carboxylating)
MNASPGTVLAQLRGAGRSLLTAERTVLNFLQRLSGIATLTREYVEKVQGTNARIIDTRKTAPGLRVLDKYAVSCGGGMNHRVGLFDGVVIKNNHLAFHDSPADAIRAARSHL